MTAHHQAAHIVNECGDNEDDGVVHPPEHVEGVAGNQEEYPSEAVRQEEKESHHRREEDEELKGVEKHKFTE